MNEHAYNDLPLYLVVDDLNVLTPDEAMAAARVTRLDAAGAYLRVPRGTGRPFDVVFGTRAGVVTLRQRSGSYSHQNSATAKAA